jgi:hypothetical protein
MPRGANKIPADVERQIVNAYQKTPEGGKLLARKFGVGETTLYRVLKRNQVTIDPAKMRGAPGVRHYKFTSSVYRQIVARYASGEPVREIQRDVRCSRWAILAAVKRAGHVIHRRGQQIRPWTAGERATMVQLHSEGWSQDAIAQRFRTHQTTVSRLLAASGVTVGWRRREQHQSWKGGRVRTTEGYIAVFPASDDLTEGMRMANGYVLEHRLVMARHLGRPLAPHETIHHINEDKTDNRLENLQLRQGRHGKGTVLVCGDCGSTNLVKRPLAPKEST